MSSLAALIPNEGLVLLDIGLPTRQGAAAGQSLFIDIIPDGMPAGIRAAQLTARLLDAFWTRMGYAYTFRSRPHTEADTA
eukprot:1257001-Pleurochrysis_carterae.AAC.1